MPLYEYECQQCHRRLEKIQSFNSEPEKTCPHCGGALERLISAPAIQFKGAGWYITDYAKSGSKPATAGSSDSKGEKAGGSTAESPGEKTAAPAAASDSSPSPSNTSSTPPTSSSSTSS